MNKLLLHILIILIIIGIFSNSLLFAQQSTDEKYSVNRSIAVMTFANYTSDYRATDLAMPLILKSLEDKFGGIYKPSEIRDILRKNRIRSIGRIDSRGAYKLNEVLGVKYIVLGSLDFLNRNAPLEFGFSIRILDATTMNLLHARSYSATGIDFMKIFGIGKINDIETLIGKVTDKIINKISLNHTKESDNKKIKAVIVELDNSSRIEKGGKILSNQLLSVLSENNIDVIEPGAVYDYMLKKQNLLIGEIDYLMIDDFYKLNEVDLIITGFVENMKLAKGALAEASPEAELNIRILEADKKKIIFMSHLIKNGRDSETFFKLGRCNSLGQLSIKIMNEIVEEFLKDIDDEYNING